MATKKIWEEHHKQMRLHDEEYNRKMKRLNKVTLLRLVFAIVLYIAFINFVL